MSSKMDGEYLRLIDESLKLQRRIIKKRDKLTKEEIDRLTSKIRDIIDYIKKLGETATLYKYTVDVPLTSGGELTAISVYYSNGIKYGIGGASPEYTWVSKATSIAAANVRPFGTDSILAASGSSLVYPTPISLEVNTSGSTKALSYKVGNTDYYLIPSSNNLIAPSTSTSGAYVWSVSNAGTTSITTAPIMSTGVYSSC